MKEIQNQIKRAFAIFAALFVIAVAFMAVPALESYRAAAASAIGSTSGNPIRGTRSDADGRVPATRLVDVAKGTKVIVTAFDGEKSQSSVVNTV